jgi:hypothetical protein
MIDRVAPNVAGWWPRAESRSVAAVLAVAIVVFTCSWSALSLDLYRGGQIVDTPLYQSYGEAIVDGRAPYRDFSVEYPPGALIAFVLPTLGDSQSSALEYRRRFEVLMLLCGCAALVGMALVLRGLGAGLSAATAALGLAAMSPLLIGPVIQTRFDLLPAALTVAALAALVRNRPRAGLVLLALGTTVKVFPAVILPLAVAYIWRRRGRREAVVSAALYATVLGAVLIPFAVLAPDGFWDAFAGQLRRPLQIESLGAAALIAAHHVGGASVIVESGSGSENLGGSATEAIARVQVFLQAAAIGLIWLWFALRRRSAAELVAASAAAVCAFVALGKVLSPQFLIWLIPLVPLVRGRRGVAASALLVAALVLTQLWFPYDYWSYVALERRESWLVLARDLVLVALAAVLVLPARRRRQTSTGTRSASQAVARPSVPQSTTSASMRTSPLAG